MQNYILQVSNILPKEGYLIETHLKQTMEFFFLNHAYLYLIGWNGNRRGFSAIVLLNIVVSSVSSAGLYHRKKKKKKSNVEMWIFIYCSV